ncbi:tol-pal system YbgF family protein [Candidatus Cloacimonadota bacterium]
MKTIKYLIILILFMFIFSGCSKDSSSSGLSDEEKLALAWDHFGFAEYQEAIDTFLELIEDDVFLAESYSGLGWSYSRSGQLLNAVSSYSNGLLSEPANDIADDIYAGLSFAHEALGEFDNALTSSIEVGNGWQFDHDSNLSFNDIVLLRAICYYALADFANSLLEVQILAPDFECDVNTEEGRAALAAKIEELRGEV